MTYWKKINIVLCVLVLFVAGCSGEKTTEAMGDLDSLQEQINVLQGQIQEAQARVDKLMQSKVVTNESVVQEEVSVKEAEESIEEGAVATSDDEKNLKDILSNATSETIMVFICDDFDKSGTIEAFAVTSTDPYAKMYGDPDNITDCYDNYTVWYVTYSGANAVDKSTLGPGFVSMSEAEFADGTKTILSNNFRSNNDTDTAVFVVIDDNYKYLGSYPSASVTDGQLDSSTFQQGTVEGQIYEYQDGSLVLVKEYTEEF